MEKILIPAIVATILIIMAYGVADENRFTAPVVKKIDRAWEEAHPNAYADARAQEELEKAQASGQQTAEQSDKQSFFPTAPANGSVHDPILIAQGHGDTYAEHRAPPRSTYGQSGVNNQVSPPQVPAKEKLGNIVDTFSVRTTGKPIIIIGNEGKSITVKPGESINVGGPDDDLKFRIVTDEKGNQYQELTFVYSNGERETQHVLVK